MKKKICDIGKRSLGIIILFSICAIAFVGATCKAATKEGFITKVKGDTIYCKFLTKKAKKAQDSNVLFTPKKGYVTGVKKYQLAADVKFVDVLEGKTLKKKTAVKKKMKQSFKEYKNGIPVIFHIGGKKCKKITLRTFV